MLSASAANMFLNRHPRIADSLKKCLENGQWTELGNIGEFYLVPPCETYEMNPLKVSPYVGGRVLLKQMSLSLSRLAGPSKS